MSRKRTALVILAATAAVLGFEAVTHLTFDATPTSVVTANAATPGKVVMLLNGAGAPREQVDKQVRNVLREQGTLDEVVYSQTAFDKETVVNYVLDRIKPYPDVTFVTLSMGGMVAHDVIQEARKRGDTRRFKLIMTDAPSTGDDVRMNGALKWGSCLLWGQLSNWLLSPPSPEGDLTQIHPRDPEEVKAMWAKYGEYGWPGASAQGCYVFTHDPLQKLTNVSAVYIRSTKDTFVLDSGLEGWRKVVALPEDHVLRVSAAHISLMDEPNAYEGATRKAFALVG